MLALDVLTALGLPEELINQCRDILQEHAGAVGKAAPPELSGLYGGSAKGAMFDHHTAIAHKHVIEALDQMVLGLQGFADNLDGFAKDLHEHDEQAAADLTPTRKSALADIGDCMDKPDLSTNTSCQAPAGDED
jgi:hypothetical protein